MLVKVGSSLSAPKLVKCGGPQGSVLGPLLFTIYINDLPKVLKECHIIMYADDVILYRSGNSKEEVEKALQIDIDNISLWSRQNGLIISIPKTKSMLFYPPRMKSPEPLNITINGEAIEFVTSFKYLGLWLDPKLSWQDHCDKVYIKMSSRANLIVPHHHSFCKRQLKIYCDSLVMSALGYLFPVWGFICPSRLEAYHAQISEEGAR